MSRKKQVRRTRASVPPQALVAWALAGLEAEIAQTRERLTTLMAQAEALRRQSGATEATPPSGPQPPSARGTRQLSDEARQRLSERMKQRWAERRRQDTEQTTNE
jgi:hypothetical protein